MLTCSKILNFQKFQIFRNFLGGVSVALGMRQTLNRVANESAFLRSINEHIFQTKLYFVSRVLFHKKTKPGIYIPRIYITIVNKVYIFITAQSYRVRQSYPLILPAQRHGNIWCQTLVTKTGVTIRRTHREYKNQPAREILRGQRGKSRLLRELLDYFADYFAPC